jgi:2-Cys peroxiredoxin 5
MLHSPGRRLAAARQISPARAVPRRPFHASGPASVKVGDALPHMEVLREHSPGNKVNLAEELTGKGLIIGIPAAFRWAPLHHPACLNPRASISSSPVLL